MNLIPEHDLYLSGSVADPYPIKKEFSTRKIFKNLIKNSYPMCCVFILGTKLPIFYKQSLKLGLKKIIFCFQWFLLDPDPYSLIRIRILNPANTDPGK